MSSFSLSELLFTIASFIVAIVILVGVHEFGHFWVARRVGIRVLRFSIGFGKPLWKRISKKDGVEYVIGAIPLGGYVKLLGERNDDDQSPIAEEDLRYAFNRAPVWKRVLVLVAGPAANLLLAAFFYWIVLLIGIPALKPVIGEVTGGSIAAQAGLLPNDLITAVQGHEVATTEDAVMQVFSQLVEGTVQLAVRAEYGSGAPRSLTISVAGHPDLADPDKTMKTLGFGFWKPAAPPVIQQIEPGSAAELAGLQIGDAVLEVDQQTVADFPALVKIVEPRAKRKVNVNILRNGQVVVLPVTIGEQSVGGRSVGKIGIGALPPSMLTTQKYGFLPGFYRAVVKTWDACVMDLKVIGQMLSGKLSVKNLSGTVGIAQVTGQVAHQGLLRFIGWLAFFSVNLGILNLLPIPMLDGGQIVYQLIELVKGSPVSERVQLITQQIGIAALIMLVSLTLYNDIARLLS